MNSLDRLIALLRDFSAELKQENDQAGGQDERSDVLVSRNSLDRVPHGHGLDGVEVIQK